MTQKWSLKAQKWYIKQFYEFAVQHFKFPIFFVEQQEIVKIEEETLKERFKYCKVIDGTLKLHMFCSIANDLKNLKVFEYSNSKEFEVKRVSKIRATQV